MFFFNSVLLGVGLAMDAFSVSLANGLNEPQMKAGRACMIAGVFAFFQALMPMTGWICVHTAERLFASFQKFIPWIALLLLGFIGGKMLYEGIVSRGEQKEVKTLTFGTLLLQGLATSIDALSVGLTLSGSNWLSALVCALIIAGVTFGICLAGVQIGKRFGTRLAGKAGILGGCILIVIGIEIFLNGILK